jgi:N-acetylglutamate synthase-like GNAT family acetyltransferase
MSNATAPAKKGPEVRPGLAKDTPRIAELLELNGIPRWVAFEERFIIAEDDGKLLAVLRFHEDSVRLYLGLLVTDPWAEEHSVAVALYAGARAMARGLGLQEIRAQTRQNETHPRDAGYRRWGGVWRLDVVSATR